MQRIKNGQLEWLQFDLLADQPDLIHGSFTRKGGRSSGPFCSLNVASHTGDDSICIQANIDLIKTALQIPLLKQAYQCHSSNVCEVVPGSPVQQLGADALMTDTPRLGLMIQHADCQAAIFYDPINKALANVHAGWRGNVKNIYARTVEAMHFRYGSKPENLLVCISPSLGPEAAEFIHFRDEFPRMFWDFQIKPNFFDLWAIGEAQLRQCGILPHHIEIARLCTFTHSDDFFSYRRQRPLSSGPKPAYGAQGTVCMLN